MNLERAIRATSATAKRAGFGKLLAEIGKLPKKALLSQALRWGMV
jgi:hypothetical protein